MKRYILALALAGVGCSERPQPHPAQKTEDPAEKFAVGRDIEYPSLIAKDLKGRKYEICESASTIMGIDQKALREAKYPSCATDDSLVRPLGDEHYAIDSWVEVGGVRTEYSGEAVITEVGGIPRSVRFTRLEKK
jgi:hypothetical protein